MEEKLAEENENRTEEEVFLATQGNNEFPRELTGRNARRDVMLMELASKVTEVERRSMRISSVRRRGHPTRSTTQKK